MLEGKNNTFSLPWEKKPSCKIVSLFQPSSMATVKTLFKDVDVCQMCLSLWHDVTESYSTEQLSIVDNCSCYNMFMYTMGPLQDLVTQPTHP